MLEIREYTPEFEADFKRINLQWLNQYDLLEDGDLNVLNNLQSILDHGGHIFIAIFETNLVGTLALVRHNEDEFELVKMAVTPDFQRRGIGKLLLEAALKKAIETGAGKICLYTSSKLIPALKLYEKHGFVYLPNVDSPFVTADIKMGLLLVSTQKAAQL
jgi:putative acetyltransferase